MLYVLTDLYADVGVNALGKKQHIIFFITFTFRAAAKNNALYLDYGALKLDLYILNQGIFRYIRIAFKGAGHAHNADVPDHTVNKPAIIRQV